MYAYSLCRHSGTTWLESESYTCILCGQHGQTRSFNLESSLLGVGGLPPPAMAGEMQMSAELQQAGSKCGGRPVGASLMRFLGAQGREGAEATQS